MIRVALDARRVQDTPLTGVGRQIVNLLPYLDKDFDMVLLTDERRASPQLPYEIVPLPGVGRLREPAWLHVSVARWLRGFRGVFHGTYNAVPLTYRGPSVATIHDLSWIVHPEDHSRARRLAGSVQARLAARSADRIVAVSEHARQSIIARLGVAAEKVLMAPPAVDPVFSPRRSSDTEVLSRFGVRPPYVLAIGGAPRRGVEVAVAAWRRLPSTARGRQLVIVGKSPFDPEPGLVGVGRPDDESFATLLAGAEVFCYPTRYEGYGMPALEAAASGTPVVCARVGPLPEVLGEAAEWCAAPTVDAVADALERVIVNPVRAEELRRAGLARAASSPTWAGSAEVLAGAYRAVAT